MKRLIFVAMFLVGLGSTVFSQNKTTEKVLIEYQFPFFPENGMLHGIFLQENSVDGKKMKKFVLNNVDSWKLAASATHIVTIQKVATMKGKRKTGTFFRLANIETKWYPAQVDSIYYEIPCYQTENGISCVQGVFAKNTSLNTLFEKTFGETRAQVGTCWLVTVKEIGYNEDYLLKKFVLQSMPIVTYPIVEKKN